MKVLKIVLLVILAIIAIPLVLAIFTPKEYSVKREVVINKPHSEVYDYTRYLKNQDNFSKWSLMDPDMKKTYNGNDGEIGFVAAWESDDPNVGVGEQEIVHIEEGKRIDYALRFKEPFEAADLAYMEFEAVNEGQTRVVWGFDGQMAYPMNAMLVFMDMEKMIGDDFEVGLQNLKKIMEN